MGQIYWREAKKVSDQKAGLATKKFQNALMSKSLDWESEEIDAIPVSATGAWGLGSKMRNKAPKVT